VKFDMGGLLRKSVEKFEFFLNISTTISVTLHEDLSVFRTAGSVAQQYTESIVVFPWQHIQYYAVDSEICISTMRKEGIVAFP
jgi:hypothetical protein